MICRAVTGRIVGFGDFPVRWLAGLAGGIFAKFLQISIHQSLAKRPAVPRASIAPSIRPVGEWMRPAPPGNVSLPSHAQQTTMDLGHSFDRIGFASPPPAVSAASFMPPVWRETASPGVPPVQRVIYRDKEKKEPYHRIGSTSLHKGYVGTPQQGWIKHLHDNPDAHYTEEEARTEVGKLKAAGKTPPTLGKEEELKVPVVPRQTTAAMGSQVNYLNHPKFRTERRLIRRMNEQDASPGEKNIYTKRYRPTGKEQRPFKLVTSSIPPKSLPTGPDAMPLDDIVDSRLGQTLHSEGVTDKIEKGYLNNHFSLGEGEQLPEDYSASSREQCEDCRYHYVPRNPDQHVFGSFYSGTTDHIQDEALRGQLIANKGIMGGLELNSDQKGLYHAAAKDAKAARQHGADQNPKLAADRKTITEEDSAGEHTSDDDDVYVSQELYREGMRRFGKGNIYPLNPRLYHSPMELQKEREKTTALLEKKRKKLEPSTESPASESKSSDDGEERKGRQKKKLKSK